MTSEIECQSEATARELGGEGHCSEPPSAPANPVFARLAVADSVSDCLIYAASIFGSLCLTASVFDSL